MPTTTFSSDIVDTFIRQDKPTTQNISATALYTDLGTNADMETLLTFTNLFGSEPGQIPLGATITSATLTLQTTDGSSQGASLHRMLTDWMSLSTVTWNSLGNGVQFDDTEAVATADVITGPVRSGIRDFDVTSSLQAWAGGAANYGWVFKPASEDGWAITSSEGTTKPVLTVTYTTDTTPPPDAGFRIVQTDGNTAVTEGGATDTFTMALTSAPTADVVVTINGTQDATGAPSTLTFTSANWQTAQTVTVTAVNDTLAEGPETSNLTFSTSSTDTRYNNFSVAPIAVTITDNDASTPPPINATVVNIIDTTQYKAGDAEGYGIGDPSGLAYVPGRNAIFIADSEHDESPYFSTTNLFAIRPDGTFIQSFNFTGVTVEPTGLAYNPKNGYLYITDDDTKKVLWVDPNNPTVKLGEFSVRGLGMTDPEDPKIDPVSGNIYMLDGLSRTFFELTPTGSLVRSFALPSVMTDAEALAYDARHEVFFVASGATRGTIFEMDRDGHLLATINLLNGSAYNNPNGGSKPKIKGLELAPSSNPNDGDQLSLYAAEYGQDQKNDGRLFEIDLGNDWLLS